MPLNRKIKSRCFIFCVQLALSVSNILYSSDVSAIERKSVDPLVETFLYGWRVYDPNNPCASVGVGTWTIDRQPVNGTARAAVYYDSKSPECTGTSLAFNGLYYTWTSKDPSITRDQLNATWHCGTSNTNLTTNPCSDQYYVIAITMVPPTVKINTTDIIGDIINNKISFTLTALNPKAISGVVTMSLVGVNGNSFDQTTNRGLVINGGSYALPYDKRYSIPAGYYKGVKVSWATPWNIVSNESDASPGSNQVARVLGIIRHTQYNVPDEIACPMGAQNVYIADLSNCGNWTPATLKPQFVSQTLLNGTGKSQTNGILKPKNATSCNSASYPTGGTSDNTFVRVASITGSCNAVMDETMQAAYPNPRSINGTISAGAKCGYQTAAVDNGNITKFMKKIQDYCPGCTDDHLDNFSRSSLCSGHAVGSIGSFWTVERYYTGPTQ